MLEDTEARIAMKYLGGTYGSMNQTNLVKSILDFYNYGKKMNLDIIKAHKEMYLESSEKRMYYRSQEEIQSYLDPQIERIKHTVNSIDEMIEISGSVLFWQELYNSRDNAFEKLIFDKLKQLYIDSFCFEPDYRERFTELNDPAFIESKALRELMIRLYGELEIEYWNVFSQDLKKFIAAHDYKSAIKYSQILRKNYLIKEDSTNFLTRQITDNLLTTDFAPAGSVSEDQYACFSFLVGFISNCKAEYLAEYFGKCIAAYPDDMMLANRLSSLFTQYHLN